MHLRTCGKARICKSQSRNCHLCRRLANLTNYLRTQIGKFCNLRNLFADCPPLHGHNPIRRKLFYILICLYSVYSLSSVLTFPSLYVNMGPEVGKQTFCEQSVTRKSANFYKIQYNSVSKQSYKSSFKSILIVLLKFKFEQYMHFL